MMYGSVVALTTLIAGAAHNTTLLDGPIVEKTPPTDVILYVNTDDVYIYIYMYIHIYIYIYLSLSIKYIYIYIYIHREREREREMYVLHLLAGLSSRRPRPPSCASRACGTLSEGGPRRGPRRGVLLRYSPSLRGGTLKGVPNCTNNLFVVPGQRVAKVKRAGISTSSGTGDGSWASKYDGQARGWDN